MVDKKHSNATSPIDFSRYVIRLCYSKWIVCRVCDRYIRTGDRYYDGGMGRRAHVSCVQK